ncbi:MAG: alkaline phosphatase family protein [Maioricimonas sp. JB049]
MHQNVVLLSIPGLRPQDLPAMPRLSALASTGTSTPLVPSFPCVTLPVQANVTTGVGPEKHGVVANGYFYRDKGEFEMWTAWNESVQAPQIWQTLREHDPELTSAVWFPMFAKGAQADYICTPAPIHNPDGSESLWCYTQPQMLYGELRDTLGHFPLMNFWGPMASIRATDWIADSAVVAAAKFKPRFSYIYLSHLDYAAQKTGPDSPEARAALSALDEAIGRIVDGYQNLGMDDILWLAASEYVITEVNSVGYPNRILREASLLTVTEDEQGGEILDVANTPAWAMVDHQFAHVFVKDESDIERVAALFREEPTVERVLVGDERSQVGLNHPRSGEIVLVSQPDAWLAYYYWFDDAKAPAFARTVDIHRKPGYDPVEMFIDMPTKSTPLDATLVKGSHGYPADDPSRHGLLITTDASVLPERQIHDVDLAGIVLDNFGVPAPNA